MRADSARVNQHVARLPAPPASHTHARTYVHTRAHTRARAHTHTLARTHTQSRTQAHARTNTRPTPRLVFADRCTHVHGTTHARVCTGGGLLEAGHRDSGSTLTMSVLLSSAGEAHTGGEFVTYADGLPVRESARLSRSPACPGHLPVPSTCLSCPPACMHSQGHVDGMPPSCHTRVTAPTATPARTAPFYLYGADVFANSIRIAATTSLGRA